MLEIQKCYTDQITNLQWIKKNIYSKTNFLSKITYTENNQTPSKKKKKMEMDIPSCIHFGFMKVGHQKNFLAAASCWLLQKK